MKWTNINIILKYEDIPLLEEISIVYFLSIQW